MYVAEFRHGTSTSVAWVIPAWYPLLYSLFIPVSVLDQATPALRCTLQCSCLTLDMWGGQKWERLNGGRPGRRLLQETRPEGWLELLALEGGRQEGLD